MLRRKGADKANRGVLVDIQAGRHRGKRLERRGFDVSSGSSLLPYAEFSFAKRLRDPTNTR